MNKLNFIFVDEISTNKNNYILNIEGVNYNVAINSNRNIEIEGTPLNAETLNKLVDKINEIIDNQKNVIQQKVLCPHRYEITGNTGDEHGLAIEDQQMLLDRVQGRTLSKNQLINKANFPQTQTISGITFTNNGDGSFTVNGITNDYSASIRIPIDLEINSSHKYFLRGCPSGGGVYKYLLDSSIGGYDEGEGKILNTSFLDNPTLTIIIYGGVTVSNLKFIPQLIDLTLMYGAGNEPTTIEQVLNDFPEYMQYDEGSFIHSKNNLISTGRNVWDEEFIQGSIYGVHNGIITEHSSYFRSKDLIKVLPNTAYYLKSNADENYFVYYDINKNYISFESSYKSKIFTIPSNAHYIGLNVMYTTYNNDICINVSDESFNGTYEPYQEDVMLVNEELKAFDYIDNVSGKKTFVTGKYTFSGNETITKLDGTYPLYSIYLPSIGLKNTIKNIIINTNYFAKSVNLHSYTINGIEIQNDNVYFQPNPNEITTVEQMRQSILGKTILYEKATPTYEEITLPAGYAVAKYGMQIQQGTIPYLLTKNYSLNMGAQVKANIAIDKEQQAQIDILKTEHKELREDFDSAFSNSTVKRETNALIDYPSKELSYPNQQVTVDEIRGRSLVVNQYINGNGSVYVTGNNINIPVKTFNGIVSNPINSLANPIPKGHKMLCIATFSSGQYSGDISFGGYHSGEDEMTWQTNIILPQNTNLAGKTYYVLSTTTNTVNEMRMFIYNCTTTIKIDGNVDYIDLTQMYESGNEPTDINQILIDIEKFKVNGAIPYNLGELKDVEFSGVKSVGVNIWDEEWEQGWIDANGNNYISDVNFRSKNYIPCLPNTEYYVKTDSTSIAFRFYDNNKKLVSISGVIANQKITTPTNAYFMRLFSSPDGQSVYNHDICINVSNDQVNSQYFPYEEDTYEIPQVDLKSAGTACNSLYPSKGKFVKRIGVVDLGTLNYAYTGSYFYAAIGGAKTVPANVVGNIRCPKYPTVSAIDCYSGNAGNSISGVDAMYNVIYIYDSNYTDVATYKAAMSGVKLYYELAEPIETSITCPNNYKVWQYGTEMQLGNFPTTITKDYSISILDQIIKNVEIDKNQSDLIDNILKLIKQKQMVFTSLEEIGYVEPAGEIAYITSLAYSYCSNFPVGAKCILVTTSFATMYPKLYHKIIEVLMSAGVNIYGTDSNDMIFEITNLDNEYGAGITRFRISFLDDDGNHNVYEIGYSDNVVKISNSVN